MGPDGYGCKLNQCMYPMNCKRRQECLAHGGVIPMSDNPRYDTEEHGEQGRTRHGSPLYYELLQKMAETHDKKSHDYASNDNPFGNYHFAGLLSKLFDNSNDAGFIGRLGEKFYRLANLENSKKETVAVKNESVEDTETDIAVITLLWIVDRRQRRAKNG